MNINSAVNAVRQGGASGKGLDMNNRDPNNVNSHIQVIRAYQYGNKVSLKITVDCISFSMIKNIRSHRNISISFHFIGLFIRSVS